MTSQELPLFPLNTVLFPGMPLYLHIFEPRYKLMLGECIREQRPFGVVLIRSGSEVGSGAMTYDVGTTAHITHVKPLAEGEMNIASVGQSRFRILSTHNKYPYLSGIVEDFPLENVRDPQTRIATRRVAPMIRHYLETFAKIGELDFSIDKLPDDPSTLAYLTAIILNIPAADKQHLLEVPDLPQLLHLERKMLGREAMILNQMVENGPRWRDDPGLFSPN